jgi:hypothetical protein
MNPRIAERWTTTYRGWDAFAKDRSFGSRDRRLHLGLVPQPFAGAVEAASIFVLMLNPGLSPVDYFAEYQVPAFGDAVVANLRQSHTNAMYPNIFLNPEFSWHSGFAYWHGKFRELIATHSVSKECSHVESLRTFSRSVAFLELYPYHSESFHLPRALTSQLHSAKLARSYAHEVLVPRAQRGETLLLVTRQASAWGLTAGPKVIVYSPGEARGAHMTPGSRGGEAILNHISEVKPAYNTRLLR